MKKIRYFSEALALNVVMLLFRLLPLDAASATGGFVGRVIGPRLAASRKARRNLAQALTELCDTEQRKAIIAMWENLGRVMAEYPHLEKIGKNRVSYEINEKTRKLFEDNRPCMMAGAHLANWEVGAVFMLLTLGKPVDLTYRAPNNPWADKLLMKVRTLNGRMRAYPKSRSGGQDLIRAMRDKHYVGVLIDQKYNEGIPVDFFNRPAMTNPVFVQMANKFDYPIIPWQIERVKGAHFQITIYEPLETQDKTVEEVIKQAHIHLENWIRKNPEQWLWLHRRWDSKKLQSMKEAA